MIKKTLIATALLASSSAALAEISANVTLATDYAFRGISQTDNQFAIQGGFDWASDMGIYLGTWASNVDSQFFGGATDPQIELDLYGGYANEFSNGLGYDIGYLRYQYPGGSDFNTNEFYGVLSYKGFSASVNYSDELAFVGSDSSAWYWAAGYEYTFPYEVAFSAHIGYNAGSAYSDDDALGGTYTDWSLGLSKNVAGVDLGLTYVDNTVSKSDCGSNVCEARVVASIGKSF
ncbi:MAG: TorF family putative porin [Gammaproteobacteria bacterium]